MSSELVHCMYFSLVLRITVWIFAHFSMQILSINLIYGTLTFPRGDKTFSRGANACMHVHHMIYMTVVTYMCI